MAAPAAAIKPSRTELTDFAHVGPGTLAGRYLRTFWQPVYRCEDLKPGRATPLRIMSEDFTLYRGEGEAAHALAFRCAHRGTQLSTGWVEGDDLRCFYHGWKYDGSGQCIEQPAEPEPFGQRIKIRSYPVQEYLGVVFVYLGEGNAPEMPRYREFENADEIRSVLIFEPWPVNYFNRIENGTDHVHLTFVHKQFGYPPPVGEEARETEYGVETRTFYPNGKVQQSHFCMPTMNQYKERPYDPAETERRDRLVWRVPIDDENSFDVKVSQIHVTGDAKRQFQERHREDSDLGGGAGTHAVIEQGEAILAGRQRAEDIVKHPEVTPIQDFVASVGQGTIAPRDRDHLGKSDAGALLIRKIWEREMTKLATGQPLKRWTRPDRLEVLTASADERGA